MDFPVDYVVTILVDGLCDSLCNLWKRCDVRAGADLMLALVGTNLVDSEYVVTDANDKKTGTVARKQGESLRFQVNREYGIGDETYKRPVVSGKYQLNTWQQGLITQKFRNDGNVKLLFELVPTTSDEISEIEFLSDDSKNRGLWQIARSQVFVRGMGAAQTVDSQTFRNDSANLRGGLLQATIAPVWKGATRSRARGAVSNIHAGPTTPCDVHHEGAAGVKPPASSVGGGAGVRGGGSVRGAPGRRTTPGGGGGDGVRGKEVSKESMTESIDPDMTMSNVPTAKRKMTVMSMAATNVPSLSVDSMPVEKLRKVTAVLETESAESVPMKTITLGSAAAAAAAPRAYARSVAVGDDVSTNGKTVAVARVASRKRADDAATL